MDKIKSRDDLIHFIQSLPETWVPTKCITWRKPECIALIENGGSMQEIRMWVEIEISAPVEVVEWSA